MRGGWAVIMPAGACRPAHRWARWNLETLHCPGPAQGPADHSSNNATGQLAGSRVWVRGITVNRTLVSVTSQSHTCRTRRPSLATDPSAGVWLRPDLPGPNWAVVVIRPVRSLIYGIRLRAEWRRRGSVSHSARGSSAPLMGEPLKQGRVPLLSLLIEIVLVAASGVVVAWFQKPGERTAGRRCTTQWEAKSAVVAEVTVWARCVNGVAVPGG